MGSAKSPDRSVSDLLREARAGSRSAFDEIVDLYRDDLLRYAAARMSRGLRARLEPEDAVQDAFVVAFQGLDRFEWRGPDSLGHWLRGVVEHRIRNAARGRDARLGRLSLEGRVEPVASVPSPSRAARREERFERLQQSLGSLSPEHRRVIELARIRGLKVREIAERMGRSEDAVKQLLSRALAKLKDRFGDTGSLGLPARAMDPAAWGVGDSEASGGGLGPVDEGAEERGTEER